MTREQTYESQLRNLGIWHEAFKPEIHELAEMERELQRLRKEWKAQGCPVEDKKDPLYPAICSLRRDILAHRSALGLTPSAYRRMKGAAAVYEPEEDPAKPQTVLELVRAKHAREA